MRRLLPLLILLCTAHSVQGGNSIRISSYRFSFLINEPDEWVIDVRSAAQLANFVMYEKGTTWRNSPTVVFGRIVRRGEDETLIDFIEQSQAEFQGRCPLPKTRELDLGLEGAPTFLARSYICPGMRGEIVAITEVPHYFAMFSLAADKEQSLENSLKPFKEMLSGFRWLGRPSQRRPPSHLPRNKPETRPPEKSSG
ncbi:MAG: hypothetical protein ACE5JX_05430 [Acidobacteriota bacterium]